MEAKFATFISLEVFLKFTDAYLDLAFAQCLPLFTHSINHPAEAVLQDQSAGYLDLAVTSPTHKNWRKRARTLIHRHLPLACVEFFLAETVREGFDLTYQRTIKYNAELLEAFYSKLRRFRDVLFLQFEAAILQKFAWGCTQFKKQIVRNYLGVYQLTPVDRYTSTFSVLLKMCAPLDSALTIDLIQTFCNSAYKKMRVFNRVPNVVSLELMILQAKEMKFDFWGLWSGKGVLSPAFDYIPYFMVLNLNEYSKILLLYGFPYMTGPIEFEKRCERLLHTRFQDGSTTRNIIRSVDVFTKPEQTIKRTRMMLIMDTFLVFSKFWRSGENRDFVEALVYLNRTLPLPYVIPMELYNTMLRAVVPDFEPELKNIACYYALSGVVEDDIMVSMPRRLVHLCRVAVRKILADNFRLPDGIQRLPIPDELQRYLLLQY